MPPRPAAVPLLRSNPQQHKPVQHAPAQKRFGKRNREGAHHSQHAAAETKRQRVPPAQLQGQQQQQAQPAAFQQPSYGQQSQAILAAPTHHQQQTAQPTAYGQQVCAKCNVQMCKCT